MTVKLASLITTAALALSVGLVGCSSQQPQAGTPESSAPAASAPASSEAPSQAASPTEASPTEESSPTEKSTDGDSSGKPSKAEIVTGLAAFYEKTQGLSADKAKKFATCMVDELYDKASAATLKAMMAGDPSKIDKSEAGKIAGAGNTCQSALQ